MAATAIDCTELAELACDEPSSPGRRVGVVAGALFASRYRLESRIAQGGQASVWLATDESKGVSGPRVALKLRAATLERNDVGRMRFLREILIASSLVGAHFVRILDQGIHRGIAYMAMEHLEGEDLYVRLAQRRRLGVAETQTIVRAVADALTTAHAANVVHRDLKPSNIFLTRQEGGEVVKLLDFGVSKGGADWKCSETDAGVLVGSPRYMSPEQARAGDDVDHRSDLWSLAATAYRCITGTTPFEGDAYTVIAKLESSEPRAASHVVRTLAAFDDFFRVALARDPAARYQSARELADAFDRAAGDAERQLNDVGPLSERSPRDAATGETLVIPRSAMEVVVPERGPLPGLREPAGERRAPDGDGVTVRPRPSLACFDAETRVHSLRSLLEALHDENATTLDGGVGYQIFASSSQYPGAGDEEADGGPPTRVMTSPGSSPWGVYAEEALVPRPKDKGQRFAAVSTFCTLLLCLLAAALLGLGNRSPPDSRPQSR